MKRIDDWHAKNAMQTAISDGEESVTYQELEQRVQKRAKILAGIPQKVILAPMSNAIDQLINFLALIRADKVAVPVNAVLSDQGLQDILAQFEAPLVLTDIRTISQKAAEPYESDEYASASDLAFIGFTSGTTGQPKGYRRTHQSWVKSFEGTNQLIRQSCKQSTTVFGSMHYSLSLYTLMQTLYFGQTFILNQHFSTKRLIALVKQKESLTCYLVPTMIHSLVSKLESQNEVLTENYTIISSGAKLNVDIRRKLYRYCPNVQLYEFYGSSETSYISMETVQGIPSDNSVGQLFPGVEIIIDQPNAEGVGEIQVRSPLNFAGYHRKGEDRVATVACVSTGDLGKVAGDTLEYFGRKDDCINRGGEKFYPLEFERQLLKLAAVAEIVVLGIPDAHYNEKIGAIIVWADQIQEMSLTEINAYLSSRMSRPAKIDHLFAVEEIPKQNNGKISRKQLLHDLAKEREPSVI
ncbi:class I adenylate-forming enzyme family protein [Trichococcus ilyis]|uniref:Amp-dependent synthetase/ligase n=1 Tax=Trichococcus ilyis TaxID=640938 RepID=A0A143YJ45_9LACT|nr:AMP-binding protein [Trichococcus ilyis]CZQ91239.1 amp-dependent synthetase/ligase [Trichococcus ilyis]SEI73953.1 long-chain acyl-CoA synthetase [Trichococcus ilyis]